MKIISRGTWHARDPRPRSVQDPSRVREFFIHWPGEGDVRSVDTAREEREFMRNIQGFHMNVRGWSDFAYNFAVFQSGRVYRGRGMDYVPAAQKGHNTNTVAVLCVVGPGQTPSAAMKRALRSLKNHCDARAGRDLTARPHGDVTGTSCPGPALRSIIPELNRRA